MSWSSALKSLQQQGTITGFALITSQGPAQPTSGYLKAECAEGVTTSVQALIQPFYSASEPPNTHTLNGTKLQVIHRTDSCYVAIAKQRQLGLIALNLPVGVLLVTFDRSTHPTTLLTAVQAACNTGAGAAFSQYPLSNSSSAAAPSSGTVSAPS